MQGALHVSTHKFNKTKCYREDCILRKKIKGEFMVQLDLKIIRVQQVKKN